MATTFAQLIDESVEGRWHGHFDGRIDELGWRFGSHSGEPVTAVVWVTSGGREVTYGATLFVGHLEMDQSKDEWGVFPSDPDDLETVWEKTADSDDNPRLYAKIEREEPTRPEQLWKLLGGPLIV